MAFVIRLISVNDVKHNALKTAMSNLRAVYDSYMNPPKGKDIHKSHTIKNHKLWRRSIEPVKKGKTLLEY